MVNNRTLLTVALSALCHIPAIRDLSDQLKVAGNTGVRGENLIAKNSARTGTQSATILRTGTDELAPVPAGSSGLPQTRLDSFVRCAGTSAELIYGDESANWGRGEKGINLPPYFGFTPDHRINSGINGTSEEGLTTEHGSVLPNAWGGDEFVHGPEFSRSGGKM